MKKNIKLFVGVLIGIIISGLTVYAVEQVTAEDISYKGRTVKDSLNELYIKANSKNLGALKFCKFIDGTYGSYGEIGSKYECEVVSGVKYNFYLLTNRNSEVDLIMDRNITEGEAQTRLTWYDAMDYIDSNNLKTTWTNVLNIDLPKAQAIADAVGRTDWKAARNSALWCLESKKKDTSSSPYCNNNDGDLETLWLWDYTRECASSNCLHSLASTEAAGYWTRDLIAGSSNAWEVVRFGAIDDRTVTSNTVDGVRLVITVLKTNLYSE